MLVSFKFVESIVLSASDLSISDERKEEEKRLIEKLSKGDCDEEFLLQKISMLQLRLEEVAKSLQAERELVIILFIQNISYKYFVILEKRLRLGVIWKS